METATESFQDAWQALDPAFRRSLELAYEALRADGLAVGSVLTDAAGQIVAEGRNRAYDPPGGRDPLQGTPLAHAEMNVLAGVPTERALRECTLWSTQQPCSMCTAAAAFTGVGTIRFVAPDPWAIATDHVGAAANADGTPRIEGPAADEWVVAANLLFLASIGRRVGIDHPTIVRCQELEPETASIAIDLLTGDAASHLPESIAAFLADRWDSIAAAGDGRHARHATPG